ncbi:unnamed protein product [Rotaria sp. Silwood1]|nr:unnamed protein product [Rotaria sp. Silwood1]
MDPALIRFIPDSRKVSKKIQKVQTKEDKQIQLPGSLPLGLLQNDRSTLTTNEWTLLSNCLHAFDEQNPSARIQNSLNELTSLPPKLRLKPLELTNLIRELFSSIGPLIERSSDFHSLPVNVRQILVKRNLYITGSMNGLFLCQCRRKIARYDPNGSLIKIFVFILAFSSNCSLVTYDSQADLTIMSNSIHLVPIQNLMTRCQFQNDCNVTKKTRSHCSSCRLKKCFELGMNPILIRNIPDSTNISKIGQQVQMIEDKEIHLPTPLPLSLLRSERSTLTTNEWTLLSNFLHAFDEQNPSARIQKYLNELSSLPPKLRLKSSDTYNMVGQFFTGVQSLIGHSPDLYSLSFDARRALAKHNLSTVGAFNGIFLCRELDLFNNPVFFNACCLYYGAEFIMNCSRHSARCDPNGSLIKMLLFVVTFSSNCSIVTFDDKEPVTIMSTSIDLIRIQNLYVTVLWKYLLYVYGFKEATRRFSYLVKNIIDITHMLESMPKNETHDLMIETIATETERALVIKD